MQMVSETAPVVSLQGLSENEAAARRRDGQGNNIKLESSRSYLEIIRDNIFTFINAVLFGVGLVLVLLNLYTDALLSVGIVLLNVGIGVIQEIRAKRMLDQIALLTRPKATVLRAGIQKVIDPTEIVLGDILIASPGDQIVVDGKVVGDGKMDVDESLLTGESDLIVKHAGDTVYSGSFCVNGSAFYEAEKVGVESFANQITTSARTYKQIKTPLQSDVDLIIRILVLLSVQIGILFALAAIVAQLPLAESAKIAAVVTGLIPNGLFFMITISYAMGSVRMAGSGALIQQSNAVESMSNVDILCLDKTGTLTANHINMNEVHPLGDVSDSEMRRILAVFAASGSAPNRTSEALAAGCPGERQSILEEIPFSSARKWSAISFDRDNLRGVYVLGAPEMLHPHLIENADLGTRLNEWADQGLRVLLFAYRPEVTPLQDSLGQPQLPPNLLPMGLISFSDQLRDQVEDTFKAFSKTGIRLKIISGDNPHTVAALARQAGLSGDIRVISGPELADMNDAQIAQVAEETTIFGRITPQQKEMLVDALRSRGHYVAMIGDGVNDVLSLKKANIGISMQSGSQATRGVADIVLMNDSFAALPPAFLEGQRIVNGMQDIMRLFLTRVFYMTLVIIGAAVVGLGFPFSPIHTSLLTLLTVGIPTFALAAWARPAQSRQRLIMSVMHFVIPAAFSLALLGLVTYTIYYVVVYTNNLGTFATVSSLGEIAVLEAQGGISVNEVFNLAQAQATDIARTVITSLLTLGGLVLVLFVEPPTTFWTGGDELSGDWKPAILAAVLGVLYVAVMLIPPLREFFQLSALRWYDFLIIAVELFVWALALRFIWRRKIFTRFLRLSE